jgi:hypothetical protein
LIRSLKKKIVAGKAHFRNSVWQSFSPLKINYKFVPYHYFLVQAEPHMSQMVQIFGRKSLMGMAGT